MVPIVHGRKLTQEQYASLYSTYLHARTIDEAETPNFDVWLEEYESIEAAVDHVVYDSILAEHGADAIKYALEAFKHYKENKP